MKFLIVKTSSLGDIIHTFPVVSYLKSRYPEAIIDWVVEKPFVELVKAHPDILNVFCIDSKNWRKAPFSSETFKQIKNFRNELSSTVYDAVFDLQGNIKSGLVTFLAKSKNKVGFGWNSVPERPNLLFTKHRFNSQKGKNIREDYLGLVQNYFQDKEEFKHTGINLKLTPEHARLFDKIERHLITEKTPLIMVCPGSNWKNKQLTEKTLEDFLQRLRNHLNCQYVFIWGNDQEKTVAEAMSYKFEGSIILDRSPLPVLQNVMARMNLVIAMDSLPLHLASTTKTPTFSVFGASLASKYKPEGVQHVAIQGSCPYGKTFEKRCPILRTCSTGACIQDIPVNDIFNYFLAHNPLA